MVQQKVIRVGNSIGITISREQRDKFDLQVGDSVSVEDTAKQLIITPVRKKKRSTTVTPEFAKVVEEFIEEHKDVLEALAKR